ncbi:MAG: hypothetical protein WBA68_10385 [Alteraurantiacibacter sp.]
MTCAELEARWFALTGETMPALAAGRGWPVRFDHCFQHILLDYACDRPWREVIEPLAFATRATRCWARQLCWATGFWLAKPIFPT